MLNINDVFYRYWTLINYQPHSRKKDGNIFLVAFYECEDDYDLETLENDHLYCSKNAWIGVRPRCVFIDGGGGEGGDTETDYDENDEDGGAIDEDDDNDNNDGEDDADNDDDGGENADEDLNETGDNNEATQQQGKHEQDE